MKIRVLLEREYELNCTLEELGIDGVDDIHDMEDVDLIEDAARVTTTSFVSKSAEIIKR